MKQIKVSVDGKKYKVGVEELNKGQFNVEFNNKKYAVTTEEEEAEAAVKKGRRHGSASGTKTIGAPISGTVGKINTKKGKKVSKDDVLLTLIAMKMENEIKATSDGKVKSINITVGQNVDVGDMLIELE